MAPDMKKYSLVLLKTLVALEVRSLNSSKCELIAKDLGC